MNILPWMKTGIGITFNWWTLRDYFRAFWGAKLSLFSRIFINNIDANMLSVLLLSLYKFRTLAEERVWFIGSSQAPIIFFMSILLNNIITLDKNKSFFNLVSIRMFKLTSFPLYPPFTSPRFIYLFIFMILSSI